MATSHVFPADGSRIAATDIVAESATHRLDPVAAESAWRRAIAQESWAEAAAYMLPWSAVRQQDLAFQFELGTVLFYAGRYTDAYAQYQHCNVLRPATADVINALALSAFMMHRHDWAVHWFEVLIRLAPEHPDAQLNLGSSYFELGRNEEALQHYDRALASQPNNPQAHYNRGVVLRLLKRLDEAEQSYLQAIALRSDYAEAWSNLGVVYHERGQFDAALDCYARAHVIAPHYADAWSNAGVTSMALADYDAALSAYDNALALKPGLPAAAWNKGILLLLKGDFEAGLPLYEWRFHHQRQTLFRKALHLETPRLQASDAVAGKTILLYDEQGLGDTLQMVRYVPILAQQGARVVLRVASVLHRVLEGLKGLSVLLGDEDAIPAHDFQCPLMSLPLAMGTRLATVPADTPYLQVNAKRRSEMVACLLQHAVRSAAKNTEPVASLDRGETGGSCIADHALALSELPFAPPVAAREDGLHPSRNRLRVGLVWAGNPRNPTDGRRSIPLSRLLSALPLGPHYVSLQKEVSEQDRALLQSRPDILDLSPQLADFVDTAAACDSVDLLISVDTSVAHLAGALGRPVLLLITCVPDWRWMLGRTDSPWYPSMRLLRQPSPGDWDQVLAQLPGWLSET